MPHTSPAALPSTLRLKGQAGPRSLRIDRRGIPTIRIDCPGNRFVARGPSAARDRLWQIGWATMQTVHKDIPGDPHHADRAPIRAQGGPLPPLHPDAAIAAATETEITLLPGQAPTHRKVPHAAHRPWRFPARNQHLRPTPHALRGIRDPRRLAPAVARG